MKTLSVTYSRVASMLSLIIAIGVCSCRDCSSKTEPEELKTAAVPAESSTPNKEINKLQDGIDSKQQSIEDLEAFVQMERAKLKENPDYDQSFMMEALEDQQKLRESIKSSEAQLKKLKDKP